MADDVKIIGGDPDLHINSMFAFIAIQNGCEGVMAASTLIDGYPMMVPLVGADMKRVHSLLPVAEEISQKTGQPYRIYKFSDKVDITDEVRSLRN